MSDIVDGDSTMRDVTINLNTAIPLSEVHIFLTSWTAMIVFGSCIIHTDECCLLSTDFNKYAYYLRRVYLEALFSWLSEFRTSPEEFVGTRRLLAAFCKGPIVILILSNALICYLGKPGRPEYTSRDFFSYLPPNELVMLRLRPSRVPEF